jgi:membrane associated rhomboid family serine protease
MLPHCNKSVIHAIESNKCTMAALLSKRLLTRLRLPFAILALLWGIQLFQWSTGIDLGFLGIFPREIPGLKGVIFAPLVHGGFGHLLANSAPFLVLGGMVMFFYPRIAKTVFLLIYILTGLAVWTFGRSVFHIGMSGVVYGLVAFIFWNGIFRRNLKSIALAAIVLFYYGSMLMGILPVEEDISWESHLLGGLSGIFVSFLYKNRLETDEAPKKVVEEEPESQYFLDRDTFEQTREARKNDGRWG